MGYEGTQGGVVDVRTLPDRCSWLKRIKEEWDQGGGLIQRITELVHKGRHQGCCTIRDNV